MKKLISPTIYSRLYTYDLAPLFSNQFELPCKTHNLPNCQSQRKYLQYNYIAFEGYAEREKPETKMPDVHWLNHLNTIFTDTKEENKAWLSLSPMLREMYIRDNFLKRTCEAIVSQLKVVLKNDQPRSKSNVSINSWPLTMLTRAHKIRRCSGRGWDFSSWPYHKEIPKKIIYTYPPDHKLKALVKRTRKSTQVSGQTKRKLNAIRNLALTSIDLRVRLVRANCLTCADNSGPYFTGPSLLRSRY